jgi:hypothetical protein
MLKVLTKFMFSFCDKQNTAPMRYILQAQNKLNPSEWYNCRVISSYDAIFATSPVLSVAEIYLIVVYFMHQCVKPVSYACEMWSANMGWDLLLKASEKKNAKEST